MKVLIIGGGAAGMLASIICARNGDEVVLFEQNEKLGKKLYITGKGRCNITNACDTEELFDNITSNKKFTYSAIYSFTNNDVISFFNELGCQTKTERGNRVFPISDKSSDVINSMIKEIKKLSVDIRLNTQVKKIISNNGIFNSIQVKSILNSKSHEIFGDKLIIATGGLSYPSTGATGDGYRFAKELGHTVTKLQPSLVPINLKGDEYKSLQGLSLKNINLSVFCNNKEIYSDFGELLFTHFGISGPTVISSSCTILEYINKKSKNTSNTNDLFDIYIDLKPALSKEQLDARILRDFNENINKDFRNSIDKLLPKKLIPLIINRSGIDPYKKVSFVTKEERAIIVDIIKGLKFEYESLRGFNEAVITRGGINVKEINPSTMESKIIKGVFFAGEVIDIDAYTGGFNLQLAWSTGYLAGQNNY